MFAWSIALVVLVLVVVGVTILAVKVGAIALRLTGLDEQRANFQALSAVTGTGFTTRESELIMLDPRRRRIIGSLMVFGNVVLVTLISLLVTAFMSRKETWFQVPIQVVLLAVGIVLLYALLHMRGFTQFVKAWLNREIEARMKVRERLVWEVLALAEGYGVVEIWVRADAPYADKTLAEARLREWGLLVLAIRRGELVIPSPLASDRILIDDRLVCYGELARIRALAGATEEEKKE